MAESVTQIIERISKQKPVAEHQITYDSPSETLEPVYFWLLNFMNGLFGGKVEKLVDNFTSSPGSGHFSELSQKRTILQENVMKTMGAVNQVIKSIINLIYDMKDFEIRLEHYKNSKSSNREISMAGNLALKQIWMDNVDIKRGRGSINMLAQDLNFITLRDAFMSANTLKEAEKLDLNERVKRLLIPRLDEFNKWKELSEMELKKRFEIEKNYLRSQVNTLQLYSRWVKPYLKAASKLEMSQGLDGNPALVTAFNTVILELTLFGKNPIDFNDAILSRALPQGIKKPKRDYYSCTVVDLNFTGIPQKAGQHYVFGGRAIVSFKGYALNEDEVKALKQEMEKSDITDVMKLMEGATTESLDVMKEDIDHFLNDDKEKKEAEEKKKKQSDANPFSALFSFAWKKSDDKNKKKENEKIDITKIKKDNYVESIVRALAKQSAIETCFNVYDVYKKAHGMASHDNPYE